MRKVNEYTEILDFEYYYLYNKWSSACNRDCFCIRGFELNNLISQNGFDLDEWDAYKGPRLEMPPKPIEPENGRWYLVEAYNDYTIVLFRMRDEWYSSSKVDYGSKYHCNILRVICQVEMK